MGAAESKPEKEGTNNNQDRNDDREGGTGSKKKGSSSLEISTGTAVAVGAVVGAALLGVAWGVSRCKSKDSQGQKSTLKILSYNVCSRGNYAAIQVRMKAIGDLVQLYTPDFLCFQEITPAIFNIFQRSSWWSDYDCSMSTEEACEKQYFCILLVNSGLNSSTFTEPIGMGKELFWIETNIGTNKSLVVATSHLKSRNSNPNDTKSQYHQFKKQRSGQAKAALAILDDYPNVIFGGDMNWDEETDGEFPLLEGWVDAWTKLKGKEVGYTYDTKSNKMLKGHRPTVQKRFDRILCNLEGFDLEKIEIVGKEAIPDQWTNTKLPVLPSDHYGLLLTVCT